MPGCKLSSLYPGAGVIVTYRCTAACLHCCYGSSPKRGGEYMSKETADGIFPFLGELGCGSVHIGGGEPFLDFGKLLEVCASAKKHRIAVEYIETNAFWYTDDDAVSRKIEKLMAAGVDCLLISVDPFHNEFVPYRKVKGLQRCCQKNGMGTFLWQSGFERVVAQLDENTTHPLSEYETMFGGGFLKTVASGYGLGYNGRALKILEKIEKNRHPAQHFLNLEGDSCGARITSAHHFHLDPNGDFIPPSCNGFRANLFELCGDGLDTDRHKYFTAVAKGGLGAFFAEAEGLGFVPKEEGYASKCALCFDMKRFVSDALTKKTGVEPADIGPAGFFSES